MFRAVLDANVFVSAILNARGTPGRILDAWRDERFQLLMSHAIIEEIERVLHYPKIARRHQWSSGRIQHFLTLLTDIAILTPGELELSVITDDPADNRYLECAVEGNAGYIEGGVAKVGADDLDKTTTLESNKSHRQMPAWPWPRPGLALHYRHR